MAEKIVIELDVDSNGSSKGVGNLKRELREATQEAQALSMKFGATSSAAIKAAQKAANLREEIDDMRQTINALSPEAKFNAIIGVSQGIAGGFAAAQGALALFGAESENVQKALLKVQAAMAISQGLNEINGLRDSFQNLGIVIKSSTAYTKAATIVQGTYNFVVGASTTAMKLFRLALVATGIGAFVVAIGSLIAYWDQLTKLVNKNSESIKKWGLIIMGVLLPPVGVLLLLKKGVDALAERFDFIRAITEKVGDQFGILKDKVIALLVQVGVLNSAEENAAEARLEQSKTRENAIKKEIELAKAQGASAVKLAELEVQLNREKFLAFDQYIKARVKSGREISEADKEQYDELAQGLKLAKATEQKAIEEANKKQLDENKKKWEAKKKQDEENAKKELELLRELEDLRISNIRDERERELAQLQLSFERKIEAIRGNSETENNIRIQLEEQRRQSEFELRERYLQEDKQRDIDELNQKFENKNTLLEAQRIQAETQGIETEAIEKEQALLKFQKEQQDEQLTRESKLLSKAQYEQSISEIEKRESEKRLATQRQIESAKYALADSAVKGLGALSTLLIKDGEKQSKASKALAVAQLAIDTAKSISATIAGATTAAAAGGPAAPLLLAGYIASGLATVFTNFSTAKKLLGGGGSSTPDSVGGSIPAGPIGEISAPRLTGSESNVTRLQPEQREFNVTVNAQVVETDMTLNQKRVKDIEDKATI